MSNICSFAFFRVLEGRSCFKQLQNNQTEIWNKIKIWLEHSKFSLNSMFKSQMLYEALINNVISVFKSRHLQGASQLKCRYKILSCRNIVWCLLYKKIMFLTYCHLFWGFFFLSIFSHFATFTTKHIFTERTIHGMKQNDMSCMKLVYHSCF